MAIACRINLALVESPEYKNLFKIYKELEEFRPPYEVLSDSESIVLENETKLLDYLHERGKKGVSIQRYKGLGEMAPEQLWETTMNPDFRIFKQVTIEDAMEANEIFKTLMGKDVEARKDFIKRHAKEVTNLDI